MEDKRLIYQKLWKKNNQERVKEHKDRQRMKRPAKDMLRLIKCRAKRLGILFSLIPEDLEPLPTMCPVLGIKLDYLGHGGRMRDDLPSVDRLRPEVGYVKGNVRVISFRANSTAEEVRKVYEYMRENGLE